MKKILLSVFAITMIFVLGAGLTACNSATPQGQLANLLSTHNHEVFTYEATRYDVTNEAFTSERGTYVVKLDAFAKSSNVAFGTRTLENVAEGVRVSGELNFGNIKYLTGCYYSLISGTSFMVPAYSFMEIYTDEVKTFEMQGRYDVATFECERVINGEKLNDSVKLSGTIFDNNQFQQILRALPASAFSGGLNLTFSTAIARPTEFAGTSLSAVGKSVGKIKVPYSDAIDSLKEEGINCYRVALGRSTEVDGIAHTLYYAVDEIKYNGWGMKNVLVKAVEPYTDNARNPYEMHYSLVSATLD